MDESSSTTNHHHHHHNKMSVTTKQQQQQKLRRKKWLDLQRNIKTKISSLVFTTTTIANKEDRVFLIFVSVLGCILFLLIGAVGLRMIGMLYDIKFGNGNHHYYGRFQSSSSSSKQQQQQQKELKPIPFDPLLYRIPEAMDMMGDRSSNYAQLRQKYDTEILPLNYDRSLDFVRSVTNPIPPSFLQQEQQRQLLVHHSDQVQPDEEEDVANNNNDEDEYYDIYNCPETPPRNYPRQWNLVHEILQNWPADNVTIPTTTTGGGIYQGLCVFDYQKDYNTALRYRMLEQPFVVMNDPRVARTTERWHQPGYVEQMVGPQIQHRTEYNINNHFMYHMPIPGGYGGTHGGGGRGGLRPRIGRGGLFGTARSHRYYNKKQELKDLHGRKAELQNKDSIPQALLRMTFGEWYKHAYLLPNETISSNDEHWYFRLIGCGSMGPDGSCDKGSTEALYDELPFFQPIPTTTTTTTTTQVHGAAASSPSTTTATTTTNGNDATTNLTTTTRTTTLNDYNYDNDNRLYIGDPKEQKGIHCRFGMKGVIAENHFDQSRNAIVLLYGSRRYILSHPNQCPNLVLLPKQHSSARHSAIDYTKPDLQTYPEFELAKGNEVILQPGQVLYLPTNWFHYIVSLDLNYQCNTRSGITNHYMLPIHDCGF